MKEGKSLDAAALGFLMIISGIGILSVIYFGVTGLAVFLVATGVVFCIPFFSK